MIHTGFDTTSNPITQDNILNLGDRWGARSQRSDQAIIPVRVVVSICNKVPGTVLAVEVGSTCTHLTILFRWSRSIQRRLALGTTMQQYKYNKREAI